MSEPSPLSSSVLVKKNTCLQVSLRNRRRYQRKPPAPNVKISIASTIIIATEAVFPEAYSLITNICGVFGDSGVTGGSVGVPGLGDGGGVLVGGVVDGGLVGGTLGGEDGGVVVGGVVGVFGGVVFGGVVGGVVVGGGVAGGEVVGVGVTGGVVVGGGVVGVVGVVGVLGGVTGVGVGVGVVGVLGGVVVGVGVFGGVTIGGGGGGAAGGVYGLSVAHTKMLNSAPNICVP